MRDFRKFTLVVSLCTAIVLVAAASGAPTSDRLHRTGASDGGIIAAILQLFGIQPQSTISLPPG
jgi:hypothetical protein